MGLGLLMGWAYYTMLSNYGEAIVTKTGFLPAMVIILAFTAGSAVVMWLGEQINEFGIGNGKRKRFPLGEPFSFWYLSGGNVHD